MRAYVSSLPTAMVLADLLPSSTPAPPPQVLRGRGSRKGLPTGPFLSVIAPYNRLPVPFQVTASTSVLMILFSSSAISISLGFQGYLNTTYAAVYAPLAFVSSIIG